MTESRGPTVSCSVVCLWIIFYLYVDYIFTLSGLDKNLNKTERTSSKINSDLRIVKVVIFVIICLPTSRSS